MHDTESEPEAETEPRTLHVRVDDADRTRAETREAIAAMERGEPVADKHVLDLEGETDLARLVSETNLELIRTIARQNPQSMRETATLVDRDFSEVHRNLCELAEFGVIEFCEDGRAKRPVIRFDELVIDIPVGDVDGDSQTLPA